MYIFKSKCPFCGGKNKLKTKVIGGVISSYCYKCGRFPEVSLKPPTFKGAWFPKKATQIGATQ